MIYDYFAGDDDVDSELSDDSNDNETNEDETKALLQRACIKVSIKVGLYTRLINFVFTVNTV